MCFIRGFQFLFYIYILERRANLPVRIHTFYLFYFFIIFMRKTGKKRIEGGHRERWWLRGM